MTPEGEALIKPSYRFPFVRLVVGGKMDRVELRPHASTVIKRRPDHSAVTPAPLSDAAGTFEIAGKKVARLGFGAMRLTGLGVWGEPGDRQECVRVVRRAVELGVQLIDTADCRGQVLLQVRDLGGTGDGQDHFGAGQQPGQRHPCG